MELAQNDIEDLYYYLDNKKKETNQCILLKMILEKKHIDDIKRAVNFKLPKTRQSLNIQLKKMDYYLEKNTYLIKKIKSENLKTLIYEINNFLIGHPVIRKINIKIFHSRMNAPIKNLNKSLKKIKDTNSECNIEITTSITENDSILNDLKIIRTNLDIAYFKNNFKIRRLNTAIAENLKIFLVLININRTTTLFLFDGKKYIANKQIKDEDIIYFLEYYFYIGLNKNIDIDRITSQLKIGKKIVLPEKNLQK